MSEEVACNLCGSDDYEFVYRKPDDLYFPDDWFDVVECRRCGLGFVNPRPSIDEISRYYPAEFYDALDDKAHLRRFELESRYLPGVGEFAETDQPPFLLDVGCGPGGFARVMAEKGWRIEGVEPYSTIPIEDFPVYREPFDKLEGLERKFDALTAWAVFEHSHDPMACFEKASEVLKEGGVFVFLVTNFDSPSSRRLFQEDIPRHLYFFTKSTVKQYLAKTGFELVRADFDGSIFELGTKGSFTDLWTRYVLRRPFEWKDRPDSLRAFCNRRGVQPSFGSFARFALTDPISVLDRATEPLFQRWQLATKNYGTATYVARRK